MSSIRTSCGRLFKSLASKHLISRNIFSNKKAPKGKKFIETEKKHAANIYNPIIPAVLAKGKGVKVWDVDGKEYLDFIAGYAALNLGHCHPHVYQVLKEQACTLHLTSRALHNNVLPGFSEYITQYFNYDKVIPMNTGVEAADTAIKVARRWGYLSKKIPENNAVVIFVTGNFWGRSLAAISSSTKPLTYKHFGPFMPGFGLIPFDNISALEEVLCNPNVCAFMLEPILGEGGIVLPSDRYLAEVRKLCTENKVLWIADEIQTGLGRTGTLLAVDRECVRPDILVLGKGLAGGYVPMSAVLANDEVMCNMTPGTHGSTFGGNPLASKLAMKTLEVILEECLVENSKKMGEKFRQELTCKLPKDIIPVIRGRGLMNAITINPDYGTAEDLVKKMAQNGLLAMSCDCVTIRFTPPLTVTEEEIEKAVNIISEAVHSMHCKPS